MSKKAYWFRGALVMALCFLVASLDFEVGRNGWAYLWLFAGGVWIPNVWAERPWRK